MNHRAAFFLGVAAGWLLAWAVVAALVICGVDIPAMDT